MQFIAWFRKHMWGPGPRTARARQLRAEFAAGWPYGLTAPDDDDVKKLRGSSDEPPPTWDGLLRAEAELVSVLPIEALRLKHGDLKEEFTSLAGGAEGMSYLSRLSDPTGCTEAQVRAEVIDLLGHVHRVRTLRHGFNLIRTCVTLLATVLAGAFCVLIVGYFNDATANPQGTTPFATTMLVLAGMLGGSISALSRLYSIRWTGDLASGADNYTHMFWSLVLNFALAILEGGIFAVLLYLAFMGKLVSGILFPSFQVEPVKGMDLFHRYFEAGLASHAEYAKALIWGFVAGFSERLVPDFLGSLGSQLKVREKA